MKLVPAMYGKAAKCVACRQKFFVPRKGEVSVDTCVIQLSEHPELLRKAGELVRSMSFRAAPTDSSLLAGKAPDPSPLFEKDSSDAPEHEEASDLEAAEHSDTSENRIGPFSESLFDAKDEQSRDDALGPVRSKGKKPIHVLDALQQLCNFQYAFDVLAQDEGKVAQEPADTDALNAHRRSLEKLWARLHTTLQKSHESAQRQLSNIENEIARLTVALRVGEIDLEHFLAQGAVLRSSRESLLLWDHDLQAWQEVKDPFLAGGLTHPTLESLAPEEFPIAIPPPSMLDTSEPLFAYYCDTLRAALASRIPIEQRLAEWRRMASEQAEVPPTVKNGIHESEGALVRAEASITFYRERLQQLLADCAHDLNSIEQYRRDVLEREQKGQLRNMTRGGLLGDIEEAEANLKRVQAHIRRTLSANSPQDMEPPSPTLTRGILPAEPKRTLWESMSAYLLAAVILLPGIYLLSFRETGGVHRIALLLSLLILAQPLLPFYRDKFTRMILALFLWILQCAFVLGMLFLFSYYRPVSAGPPVFVQLDVVGILLAFGTFISGVAAGTLLVANYRFKAPRIAFTLLGCAIVSSLIVGVSYVRAQSAPEFTVTSAPQDHSQSIYLRPAPLMDGPPADPQPGPEVTVADRDEFSPENSEPQPDPLEDLSEPDLSPDPEPILEEQDEAQEPVESPVARSPYTVSFGLIGVVHGEGIAPRFRAALLYFDGREEPLTLHLGDTIVGEWKAREYNSASKKLTISNGERLLLLNAGDRVEIDAPPAEQ